MTLIEILSQNIQKKQITNFIQIQIKDIIITAFWNFSFFYPNLSKDKQDKWPGVCGSVACAIVMAYYDDYKSSLAGSGDFATDWKKQQDLKQTTRMGNI